MALGVFGACPISSAAFFLLTLLCLTREAGH